MLLIVVRDGQVVDAYKGVPAGVDAWLNDHQFVATDDADNPQGVDRVCANEEGEVAIVIEVPQVMELIFQGDRIVVPSYSKGYKDGYEAAKEEFANTSDDLAGMYGTNPPDMSNSSMCGDRPASEGRLDDEEHQKDCYWH